MWKSRLCKARRGGGDDRHRYIWSRYHNMRSTKFRAFRCIAFGINSTIIQGIRYYRRVKHDQSWACMVANTIEGTNQAYALLAATTGISWPTHDAVSVVAGNTRPRRGRHEAWYKNGHNQVPQGRGSSRGIVPPFKKCDVGGCRWVAGPRIDQWCGAAATPVDK
jgi:hypothetical protein